MKPEAYKSINSASTVDVSTIHPPIKVIDGKITYVEVKTGEVLSNDFDTALKMQTLINSVRLQIPAVRNITGYWLRSLYPSQVAKCLAIGTDQPDHYRRHLAACKLLVREEVVS